MKSLFIVFLPLSLCAQQNNVTMQQTANPSTNYIQTNLSNNNKFVYVNANEDSNSNSINTIYANQAPNQQLVLSESLNKYEENIQTSQTIQSKAFSVDAVSFEVKLRTSSSGTSYLSKHSNHFKRDFKRWIAKKQRHFKSGKSHHKLRYVTAKCCNW